MDLVTNACLCGSEMSVSDVIHEIPILGCEKCGVVRQNLFEMTRGDLKDWYAQTYFADEGAYYHTLEHDTEVAHKRLDAYKLPRGTRLLDVGCGNGAFLEAALGAGMDAWGQDLADVAPVRAWSGELQAIGFPAGSFEVITVHDVLEHVPDPVGFLEEIARILEVGGEIIVDFPRFWHESGTHHFKKVEHIWMLTEDQIQRLLNQCGFRVTEVTHPIESKIVVRATMTRQPSDVSIVVPPGIGDGYWVLSKLRAFCEEMGIYLPEVFVHDSGPRRGGDLWARVPFVRFGGYAALDKDGSWPRAYSQPGFAIQEGVQGFDYFISYNGTMDAGVSLYDVDRFEVNWFEPLFRPLNHRQRTELYRAQFGKYVLVQFWDRGFYEKWLGEGFGPAEILKTLRLLADAGYRIVVMGAEWDRGRLAERLANADRRFVNLIGETSFDDLLALVEGAERVFGHPAGNTMLGPRLGTPTTLVFGSTQFAPEFRVNCVPPCDYMALDASSTTPDSAADMVARRSR